MEGEALLNDASAVTLYTSEEVWGLDTAGLGRRCVSIIKPCEWRSTHGSPQPGNPWLCLSPLDGPSSLPCALAVFLHILEQSSPDDLPSVPSQIWPIIRDILK